VARGREPVAVEGARLNYEDEEYVRFFTRDTVSWLALGWEGQSVLSLMLHGKFDRSGVFDCDGHTPSQAVTMVTRMPTDVVERGLAALFKAGAWVHRDGKIIWPKYIHAQGCKRSDRLRQRESREKRRSDALGDDVTTSDNRDQCHSLSQTVTLSLAEQSREPPAPLPEPERPKPPDPMARSFQPMRADVLELHGDWRTTFGFKNHKLTGPNDLNYIQLAEAIDADTLAGCKAMLRVAKRDGMVNGTEDKGKKHEQIRYIFGNPDTRARLLRLHERQQRGATGSLPALEAARRARDLEPDQGAN
jgi:hypothetical protein